MFFCLQKFQPLLRTFENAIEAGTELKGGIELSKQPLGSLLPEVAALVALGFLIPVALYPLLRALRLPGVDAAALGAHYGSVSVVTFAVAQATLAREGVPLGSTAFAGCERAKRSARSIS